MQFVASKILFYTSLYLLQNFCVLIVEIVSIALHGSISKCQIWQSLTGIQQLVRFKEGDIIDMHLLVGAMSIRWLGDQVKLWGYDDIEYSQ